MITQTAGDKYLIATFIELNKMWDEFFHDHYRQLYNQISTKFSKFLSVDRMFVPTGLWSVERIMLPTPETIRLLADAKKV